MASPAPTATPANNFKKVTILPAPRRRTPSAHGRRPIRHYQELQSHSAKHALAPTDVYVGVSFRLLGLDEAFPPASDEFAHRSGKEVIEMEEVVLVNEQRVLMWSTVVTDGVGVIDTGRDWLVADKATWEGVDDLEDVKKVATRVVNTVLDAARGQSLFTQIIAISEPLPHLLAKCPAFLPFIWMHLNAIPFLIRPSTMLFNNLPDPSPEYYARAALSRAIKELHPAIHSALLVGRDPHTHEVLVDAGNLVHIANLMEYQDSTSPELWRRFMALVRHVKKRNIKVIFASATPSGGGVALMRHALVRLMRLVGIDALWIVPEGHPVVFNITKKHIHNVLQGVSQHGETLGPTEISYFEAWTLANWQAFWRDSGIFDDRLVVIDDPQLSALIPLIKEKNPDTKIIFRSHIQIQSSLTDKEGTPQHQVAEYLWNCVKQSDLYVAHPVKNFVPACIKEGKMPVLYMPPCTDPLDGLNKPLGNDSVIALRDVYNNLSKAQCGVEMDWDRGYVLQVARFDPSKGLPVLLETYLKFRQAIEGEDGSIEEEAVLLDEISSPPITGVSPRSRSKSYDFGKRVNGFIEGFTQLGGWAPKHARGRRPPMLVIVGHGSVDDPDGSSISESLHEVGGW